jgi:hypothetical protein
MSDGFPEAVNGEVLRKMATRGADMSISYDVDFEHVFPDLTSAETFLRSVQKQGRSGEITEYDHAEGYHWNVRVVVNLIPTLENVSHTEAELNELAGKFLGRTDGWGIMYMPH